jgi:translation elongation factor EF-G
MPVAESFGFTSELRSATEGRGIWSLADSAFYNLPKELFDEVVKKIRQRKGMSS